MPNQMPSENQQQQQQQIQASTLGAATSPTNFDQTGVQRSQQQQVQAQEGQAFLRGVRPFLPQHNAGGFVPPWGQSGGVQPPFLPHHNAGGVVPPWGQWGGGQPPFLPHHNAGGVVPHWAGGVLPPFLPQHNVGGIVPHWGQSGGGHPPFLPQHNTGGAVPHWAGGVQPSFLPQHNAGGVVSLWGQSGGVQQQQQQVGGVQPFLLPQQGGGGVQQQQQQVGGVQPQQGGGGVQQQQQQEGVVQRGGQTQQNVGVQPQAVEDTTPDGRHTTAFLNSCVSQLREFLPPVRLTLRLIDHRAEQPTRLGYLSVANCILQTGDGGTVELSGWRHQAEALAALNIGGVYWFYNTQALPKRKPTSCWFRMNMDSLIGHVSTNQVQQELELQQAQPNAESEPTVQNTAAELQPELVVQSLMENEQSMQPPEVEILHEEARRANRNVN